jgi:DNA-binding transcriptional ArsR family regulator
MPKKLKYNLAKNPYRGVVREVAKKEGVSQPAISQAIAAGNLRIARLVEELCKEREKEYRRLYASA